MNKTKNFISQRDFIKDLFNKNTPKKEAIDKVTEAFRGDILYRSEEAKANKTDEETAKKIVSHFYWELERDKKESLLDSAETIICNDNALQTSPPLKIAPKEIIIQKKHFWEI